MKPPLPWTVPQPDSPDSGSPHELVGVRDQSLGQPDEISPSQKTPIKITSITMFPI